MDINTNNAYTNWPCKMDECASHTHTCLKCGIACTGTREQLFQHDLACRGLADVTDVRPCPAEVWAKLLVPPCEGDTDVVRWDAVVYLSGEHVAKAIARPPVPMDALVTLHHPPDGASTRELEEGREAMCGAFEAFVGFAVVVQHTWADGVSHSLLRVPTAQCLREMLTPSWEGIWTLHAERSSLEPASP